MISIPKLTIDGSTLTLVPAVHYRAVFAIKVNHIIHHRHERPDAIAVELGQNAVNEIVRWLQEMGVGKEKQITIPCMLGLVRRNHRIHPKYRETAFKLQEQYGVPLNEIPPHVLREQLHYSALSLICLSPTDSIIEAIRSGVETGVPVYGVDMEDFAYSERPPICIEDPLGAGGDYVAYLDRNTVLCEECRDEVVDGNREEMMSAKLKYLLKENKHVLFTGGMAHWQSLCAKIKDENSAIQEARLETDDDSYTRVLVDPVLALNFIDLYPDFIDDYEILRTTLKGTGHRLNYKKRFQEKIQYYYEETEPKYRESFAVFMQYLTQLCFYEQRDVPDFYTLLTSAKATISHEFADQLGQNWLYGVYKWALPMDEAFTGLPYLRSSSHSEGEERLVKFCQKAELETFDGKTGPFYLEGKTPEVRLASPQSLRELLMNMLKSAQLTNLSGIWPPCENLLYATAYESIAMEFHSNDKRSSEPFAGTLYEGVDIKATLHSHAKGEGRIYVKNPLKVTTHLKNTRIEPVVFIFDDSQIISGADWEILQAWSNFTEHIKYQDKKTLMLDVISRYGSHFVASVHLTHPEILEERFTPWVTSKKLLYGSILFGNPCINAFQSARWLEENDFMCCPIIPSTEKSYLGEFYLNQYNMSLNFEDWQNTLIRMALPFANERVIVVAPDYFRLPSSIRQEAVEFHKKIGIIPLSQFSADRIIEMRIRYSVRPTNSDATEFPQELENLLGDSSKYFDLLPSDIQIQVDPYKE